MRWPYTGEPLRFGLDHGVEVVATQGALLLEVGADGGEVVVGLGFMHEAMVGLGAIQRRGGKGGVCRVGREQRVFLLAAVGGTEERGAGSLPAFVGVADWLMCRPRKPGSECIFWRERRTLIPISVRRSVRHVV